MTTQPEFLAASGNPVAIDQTTRALGVTLLDGSPATLAAILVKLADPATETTEAALLVETKRTTLLAGRITITAASATIQALLTAASMTMPAGAREITLTPAGVAAYKIGAAAVLANGPTMSAGIAYREIACLAATNLQLIAAGNVLCDVHIEGVA